MFIRLVVACLLLQLAHRQRAIVSSPKLLKVPAIPTDHLLCWVRSLSQSERRLLEESCNVDGSDDALDVDDWNVAQSGQSKWTPSVKRKLCRLIAAKDKQLPCWGYEANSSEHCLLYRPQCPQRAESWAPNKVQQMKMFFETADFGYIRERRSELETYCRANSAAPTSSEFRCTQYLRYCTGRNLFIDLRQLGHVPEPVRYREDVLRHGDIGGWNCSLDRTKLMQQGDHKSPLMSWFAEMANFRVAESERQQWCDLWLEKPTLVMKLDATSNLYHHFCDFLNLYMSLHVNGSTFNRDQHILIWDTFPYRSNFAPVWGAFTRHPILNLSHFKGKRVCFRDVTFPLLPRMIFGLYYNMPLIPGCGQSGLLRAFNRHLLFHLNESASEELLQTEEDTIRVTFISRRTAHRRVLNENELVEALEVALKKRSGQYRVQVVDLSHRMPFAEQIHITARSDVLVGMHGAGLTHTLFQPDYGVLFELYNCEDADCYRDLARLRGTHYLTWRDHSKRWPVVEEEHDADQKAFGAAHAKFVNYKFDAQEFVVLALEAIDEAQKRKRAFRSEYQARWWHRQKQLEEEGGERSTAAKKTEL